MRTWSPKVLHRKRVETISLAMLAIASVIPLRFFVESHYLFLAEFGTIFLAYLIGEIAKIYEGRATTSKSVSSIATTIFTITPVVSAFVARAFGSPIAFEMSALTTFGTVSLAVATNATTDRVRALSLVASGFLVLFCASISDSPYAAAIPLVWMLGCVWHLIANHWERLDLAMPASVERTYSLRPRVMIAALVVLAGGGYAVKDRIASSQRLTFGLLPTSGGSKWSDPAARGGVGTGDAAIAAKDHAESFGAVDSEIFLESTESTLFDMVNDMIGEAKKKNKWERRQAMGNENVISAHEQAAKSEKGGGTFSTERMPPKKHHHFDDATGASVVQWDGPTGIRLAMQRYDAFDGKDWSQSADYAKEKLAKVDINKDVWFFDREMRTLMQPDPDSATVGLLKVIRLASQRLPVPMNTAGIHIKEVDRQDFFGITKDGSFFMPGREKVPPLTVVHVASVNLIEDEIRESLANSTAMKLSADDDLVLETIEELVQSSIVGQTHPADRLNACVERLRTDFTFERSGDTSATSLAEFLKSRRGGDHLFATTAALMARQLGLSSRLVTGFYVRPDAFDITAGHASVLPQDVHVWAEVQLLDGRWFEIEPTPGFERPHYRPSWRLFALRFAAAYWPIFLGSSSLTVVGYLTRCVWMDWLLTAIWSVAGWLRPRQRVRLAIRIVETRARLAGQARPVGKSQRAWLQQLTRSDAKISLAAQQFSDVADRLFFGRGNEPSPRDAVVLVDLLRIRTITALTKEATS